MPTPVAKKHRYQHSIRRAVVPPIVAMIFLALLLVFRIDSLGKAAKEVDESNLLIQHSVRFMKLAVDMETGQRGFLITRDEDFLKPYYLAKKQIFDELQPVEKQVANNFRLRTPIAILHQRLNGWVAHAEKEIDQRRKSNSKLPDINSLQHGKELMDGLRDDLQEFLTEEQARRDRRSAAAQRGAKDSVGVVLLIFLVVGLGLAWYSRRHLIIVAEEYEGALIEEEVARERLTTTLTSIGDAVIVTDAAGRVTLINTVTEELTGWSSQEAAGKNAAEVFTIYDERTGAPSDSPIEQVLRENRIVLLANHTVLHTRDNREVVIEDSAAPIRDPRGEVVGVVLVFRDVTERKKQELILAQVAARERRIAETLQRAMLLAPGEHAFPGLSVMTRYEAAWDEAQVGGDFHDAFPLENGKVALVVGDVMGKGLGAAARTAEVKYALRVILRDGSDVATALARLNRTLLVGEDAQIKTVPEEAGLLGEGNMVALAVAVIDPATGETSIAAAGSEPPLVARAGGEVEDLGARGVLLGAAPDMEYDGVTFDLGPQDVLLLYTDGLTEAHRRGDELFGVERLSRVLKQSLAPARSLDDLGETLVNAARNFAGGTFHDDVCLLLARRDGGGEDSQ